MTPEEHLAHATAVKLMEEKDYFVQIYTTVLSVLIQNSGLKAYKNKDTGKAGFTATISTGEMIDLAETIAYQAMEPIQDYGKKK